MMKKVILVLALTLMALTAKAQFYAGGSVQFIGMGGGGAVFGLAPEAGYNFAHNMGAGASLGLMFGGGEGNTGAALSIDPYFRYYFAEWGPARFFADGHFNFTAALGQGGGSTWGVGVRPGVAFQLDDRFSMVSHLARIGYYGGGFLAGVNSSLASLLSFNLAPTVGLYYAF